ncbi:hypothetical protein GH714_011740 [Hevea brasiliensis]|uniref:RNase H type-1 domain-containing protein n=1 Tax=Hevea brasiliensis TaxID=3981 RepID=A0A6A6KBC9_HEVBR|nr:hypothetical protein GH714_011740 [Hevea brasiliensis]
MERHTVWAMSQVLKEELQFSYHSPLGFSSPEVGFGNASPSTRDDIDDQGMKHVHFREDTSFRDKMVEDVTKALIIGPWVVLCHYLTVQLWTHEFVPSNNLPSKVAVWFVFQVGWSHPSNDWVKVNIDGSVMNGRGTARGLIRGLSLSWNAGYKQVVIKIDSLTTYNTILGQIVLLNYNGLAPLLHGDVVGVIFTRKVSY